MEFKLSKNTVDKQRASCVVVAVHESRRLSPSAEIINDASGGELVKLARSFDMKGSTEESLLVNDLPGIAAKRVLLVGCGKSGAMGMSQYRRVIMAGIKKLIEIGVKDALVCLAELEVEGHDVYWKIRQIVESIRDNVYRFDELKSKSSAGKAPALRTVLCALGSQRDARRAEEAIRDGVGISDGVDLAKDLGNLPGNICTPTYLAERARQLLLDRRLVHRPGRVRRKVEEQRRIEFDAATRLGL